MSDQIESELLTATTAIKAPLRRLGDSATNAAQESWEHARWQRHDTMQRLFESCQSLTEAIDHAERVLASSPPAKGK